MDLLILNHADSIKNIEAMKTSDLYFYGKIWEQEIKNVDQGIKKIEDSNGQ